MAALQSTSRLLTVDDALVMDLPEHWELIEGVLVELQAASSRSSRIGLELGSMLIHEGQRRGLGWAFGANGGFILDKERRTFVSPDASFVRLERLERPDRKVLIDLAPDLAIEVLSPSDRHAAALRKAARYTGAGTELVWLVDPIKNRVTVIKPDATPMVYSGDAELTAEPVLPDVRVFLAELFRDLG